MTLGWGEAQGRPGVDQVRTLAQVGFSILLNTSSEIENRQPAEVDDVAVRVRVRVRRDLPHFFLTSSAGTLSTYGLQY